MYTKLQWKHRKETISVWCASEFTADSKEYYLRGEFNWSTAFKLYNEKNEASCIESLISLKVVRMNGKC